MDMIIIEIDGEVQEISLAGSSVTVILRADNGDGSYDQAMIYEQG